MANTAIALRASAEMACNDDFVLDDLQVFTSIPRYHHDVVVLEGLVVVYNTDSLCREGIQDGALYVVESQRPPSLMPWEMWLKRELLDSDGRGQPQSRLTTQRRVIRAVRADSGSDWWHVLPGGRRDGPYPDWSIGFEMVGRVVGIYRPN